MPFALLIVGAILLTAGVRGKQDELYSTVKGDFIGPHNFIFWMVSIFAIGALGYFKPLKPLSDIFLALVIVVLFLANKGFFAKFSQAIGSTQSGVQNASMSGPAMLAALPPIPSLQPLEAIQV